MANVSGTIDDDFIHVVGDARVPPAGANDIPEATNDADTIDAGLGDDTIYSGGGDDTANYNISTDGEDRYALGDGMDTLNISADAPQQVRLTFTSSEVGNGEMGDSGTMANQDGGRAVRIQAEDGSDGLMAGLTRADDEGITFRAGAGVTFDVRDLVSGAARGDGFEVVTLGTQAGDAIAADEILRPTYVNGGQGDDTITGGDADDFLVGGAGADSLIGGEGDDTFIGGSGADVIQGDAGADTAIFNVTTDGSDAIDLGADSDVVNVNANAATNVRLTFTSSEVGNGSATDSNTMAGQDGGLAVRMQAEDGGSPTGPVTRVDDEGITFVGGAGVTFDVRDLVSGAARGELFEVVTLGTSAGETLTAVQSARPYYINAGMGDDSVVGGTDNDFLVGGAGADTLVGGGGNDSFIGGGGNDAITGGSGSDVATHNITTDGADTINLRGGSDVLNVNANAATNVRLTFTSSEVGNGVVNDSNTMAGQDGGLAVRMQAEDGSGELTGPITRVDDEGITFVGGAGVTFDVRDLVSGAARGEQFEVVTLGSQGNNILSATQAARPYYINGGMGNDLITGGMANDFLVGGAGADTLVGGMGNDSFIGGGGADSITGGDGANVATQNITTDGADAVDLGAGSDVVNVNANAATNVRLTFTSAEVGNGNPNDSNTMPGQDGGLAVRMQAEDGSGDPMGPITRTDDEGITFVGGAGVTFDVRDLVTGAARGELFEVVTLGTNAGETLTAVQNARPYYINAGMGDDSVVGGDASDFLVGGAGADTLVGVMGNDSFIGGGGADSITGGDGVNVVTQNITTDGADAVDTGAGSDVVNVNATAATNVRLTFTSSEVGNGSANDSNTMTGQDGGLAVRMQAEDGSGDLTGPITRVDDEGVTFVGGAGVTFDVRDLVSGAARGEAFEVVTLGTSAGDRLTAVQAARPYYINAGMGDDTVLGGSANDFLVGGAGADTLRGGLGDDSFIGGGGADTISGGAGVNVVTHNITTDGADEVRLGASNDIFNVNATAATNVRLTFTSSEVGNGSINDSNTLAGQDGGLAVRMQAEDGSGELTGPITRVDDEGVSFVAGAGVTFDVRDLVSGVARGDQFEVVTLGTSGRDTLTAVQSDRAYYFNAGQGNDTIVGGDENDFLVGGAGVDRMVGGDGEDSYIVDNLSDRVVEQAGTSGSDTVLTGIDGYRLTINVENLTLTGTGNISGTGNTGANVLSGNVGDNTLDGGFGNDLLIGGAGADTFSFTKALGASNVDTIDAFVVGEDQILLSSAVFDGLAPGPLDDEAFYMGAAATETDDRIIYDDTTGSLFYDRDGSGAQFDQILFARVNAGTALSADDFVVA